MFSLFHCHSNRDEWVINFFEINNRSLLYVGRDPIGWVIDIFFFHLTE